MEPTTTTPNPQKQAFKSLTPIITTIPSPSPSFSPPQPPPSNHLTHLTTALTTLTTALALAILATTTHAYSTYRIQTNANNPWWLPIWPGHFSTAGTRATIGASAGIVFLNVVFVVVRVWPGLKINPTRPRPRPILTTLPTLLTPLTSLLLALSSIILTHLLNTRPGSSDTIQTWTCKFATARPSTPMLLGDTRGEMSNEKFALLCAESRFGMWGMVGVVGLQVVMGGVAVGEWVIGRRAGKGRGVEMEMGVIEADRKTEFSF
ncbi:hypothetical protein Vi05172_g11221 [Venturia inaequalis]|nr:hypothetical protein Vi05172_g11221 [Venturia inaequalis]